VPNFIWRSEYETDGSSNYLPVCRFRLLGHDPCPVRGVCRYQLDFEKFDGKKVCLVTIGEPAMFGPTVGQGLIMADDGMSIPEFIRQGIQYGT
jgi:hypothetical protein